MNWLKHLSTGKTSAREMGSLFGEDIFFLSELHFQNIQGKQLPIHSFLHFVPGNIVYLMIIQFVPGNIDKLVEQFDTFDQSMKSQGKYELKGENLAFSIVHDNGMKFEYQGQIVGDRLCLHIRNRKNNYQEDETFFWLTTRQKHLENIALNNIPGPQSQQQRKKVEAARYADMAWECSRKRNVLKAIEYADQAIHLDPLGPNWYYLRGVMYHKTGDYTMAIADLDRAIALVPAFPGAITERGFAFLNSGNMEQALRDYDEAIRIDQNYFVAHTNKGSLLVLQNKWEEAIKELNESLRLRPEGSEELYLNRAGAYEMSGNIPAAIQDLEQYIHAYPNGWNIKYAQEHLDLLKTKPE